MNDSSNSSDEIQKTGNTKLSSTKQISPSKRWCFTLNNYSEMDISSIVLITESECKYGIIGKEVGKECATPHLQGYVEFITKVRPKNMFINRIHWEKCRGSRIDNVTYCSKDGKVIWTKGFPKAVKMIDPTYYWEKEILREIEKEPDDRKIWWYVGDAKCGKTSFCKYLAVKHSALINGGKAADMRNAIVEWKKAFGDTPRLIVMNIPRSFKAIDYEGIENVKDMLFYSGKYEGGMIAGNCPHVFVFANEEPDVTKLSSDRWRINQIVV